MTGELEAPPQEVRKRAGKEGRPHEGVGPRWAGRQARRAPGQASADPQGNPADAPPPTGAPASQPPRLTPPPAQGSRSPLEKIMLLAALRSERHAARVGDRDGPQMQEPQGRSDPSCGHTGKGAAPHPTLDLTSPPEVGLQPVLPGPHAPRVQAVLLAVSLGERQVGEEVRHVVTGERQVDLGAGL